VLRAFVDSRAAAGAGTSLLPAVGLGQPDCRELSALSGYGWLANAVVVPSAYRTKSNGNVL
jgi:hypothetical protein